MTRCPSSYWERRVSTLDSCPGSTLCGACRPHQQLCELLDYFGAGLNSLDDGWLVLERAEAKRWIRTTKHRSPATPPDECMLGSRMINLNYRFKFSSQRAVSSILLPLTLAGPEWKVKATRTAMTLPLVLRSKRPNERCHPTRKVKAWPLRLLDLACVNLSVAM